MNSNLSNEQELLLLKACKDNGGVLTKQLASSMYSQNSTAKSAIQKLELFDYVELKRPGAWKVVKLPNDIKRELKSMRGGEDTGKVQEDEKSKSSKFEIKA